MTARLSHKEVRNLGLTPVKRRHKYGAVRCELDGIKFDSKAERNHYATLKLRQDAGEITELAVHPKFPLRVLGNEIASYEADFLYRDKETRQLIAVDVKGVSTPIFRIKLKLAKVLYPGVRFDVVGAR